MSIYTEYSEKKCPVCGVHYSLDKLFDDYRRKAEKNDKDRGWYCPNGHYLVYTESEADTQRRRAERAEQEKARLQDELRLSQEREKKLNRRAAAALCPCCKRSFSNVSRHIRHMHPDFVASNVVKLKGKTA